MVLQGRTSQISQSLVLPRIFLARLPKPTVRLRTMLPPPSCSTNKHIMYNLKESNTLFDNDLDPDTGTLPMITDLFSTEVTPLSVIYMVIAVAKIGMTATGIVQILAFPCKMVHRHTRLYVAPMRSHF